MDEHKNGSRRTCPKTCTCVGAGDGGGGCGGGCSGDSRDRSSKRLKQKKVPQRGLGVAQLEKIRLEEQQKKDVVSSRLKSISNNDLSLEPLSLPFFTSSSSVPLPTMSSNGGSSTNSLFKPSPSMPNFQDLGSNQMTFQKALSFGGGFDGSWPENWNAGFNLDRENQKLDLDFDPINYEANNATLNFPNLMERSMTFQQSHPSSKMEPPSNQIYYGNKYSPLWQEEEKMAGLKRQYPFPMEIPPAPPFHGKLPSSLVDPFERSNESAFSSNGSPVNAKPRNPMSRESSSSILQAEENSRNVQENRDFLTLAPPLAASSTSNTKHKDPRDSSGNSSQDLKKASQELVEDRSRQPRTSGTSIVNGQPFFSFLPSPSLGSCDSEVGEKRVDLTLKL